MANDYDGLSIGDIISLDELTIQNRQVYNDSIIVVPTGNTAADGSPEMKVVKTVEYMGSLGDYFQFIAEGKVPNKSFVYKFGRAEGVDAGDNEVVVGDIINLVLPDANAGLSAVSSSAEDQVGGGGATELTIIGLKDDGAGNWNEIVVVVPLTGITPVSILDPNEMIRINRMFISKGEDRSIRGVKANHGLITVTHAGTGQPLSQIKINKGQTLQTMFTIPSGYTGYLWDADTSTGKGSDVEGNFVSRGNITGDEVARTRGARDQFQGGSGQAWKIPLPYEEKTDLVFLATTTVTGGASANISGTYQLELVKN